ncbi:CHAT domain-containing protein [Actinocorallia longicatena]|uniref:CHAT domain-containing protein n=1 Tax=Actinocorallia longicatena TaxID=111803 RepID=A0ABP6Q427_9ACTN
MNDLREDPEEAAERLLGQGTELLAQAGDALTEAARHLLVLAAENLGEAFALRPAHPGLRLLLGTALARRVVWDVMTGGVTADTRLQAAVAVEDLAAGLAEDPGDEAAGRLLARTRALAFGCLGGPPAAPPGAEEIELDHFLRAAVLLLGPAPAWLRSLMPSEATLVSLVADPALLPGAADGTEALARLRHVRSADLATPAAWLTVIGRLAAAGGPAGLASPDPADPIADIVRGVAAALDLDAGGPTRLVTVLDHLTDAARALGPAHPLHPGLLTLLDMAARLTRHGPETRRDGEALLERLEAALREFPARHPRRLDTLTHLMAISLRHLRFDSSPARTARIEALVAERAGLADDVVTRTMLPLVTALMSYFRAQNSGELIELDTAIEALEASLRNGGEDQGLLVQTLEIISALLAMRHLNQGRIDDLTASGVYANLARTALDTLNPERPPRLRGDGLAGAFGEVGGMPRMQLRTEDFDRYIEALSGGAADPDGSTERGINGFETLRAVTELAQAGTLDREDLAASLQPLIDQIRASLDAAGDLDPDQPFHGMELLRASNLSAVLGGLHRRPADLDQAVRLAVEAAGCFDRTGNGGFLRQVASLQHGGALGMRSLLTGDRADLSDAIVVLTRCADECAAAGLAVIRYPVLALLAQFHRRRGDANLGDGARSVEAGLAMLDEGAWTVLTQSSLGQAAAIASRMVGEAADVARHALAAGIKEGVVEALEAGRALILYTATADRNTAQILADEGREGMAEEWARAGAPIPRLDVDAGTLFSALLDEGVVPPVPDDLRERVRRELRSTFVEDRLWSRTGPADIGKVLTARGIDALVYLLPRDDARAEALPVPDGGGAAAVVDARGEIHLRRLPDLTVGESGPVPAFVRAQRSRLDETGPDGTWTAALEDVRRWAWPAAMRTVLEWAEDRGLTDPRLVLVPVGELSQVPWHAATRAVEGRDRPVCADAVLSYAASARQLIEAAGRTTRPWGEEAALVRVPDSGLLWSSVEQEGLGRIHPGAVTFDEYEPPTPGDVKRLIRTASMIHFSCHAQAKARPIDTVLKLSGGSELAMHELLDRTAAPVTSGPLVVIGACGTDLSADDHDESLTLATAFLNAGAAGVVGTRWPVNDLASAFFMIRFHHLLATGEPDPARALRATQRWMLDPDRDLPDDLFGDLLKEAGRAPLTDAGAWAAFAYQGR